MVVNPGERDGVANTVGDNVGTFDGSKVILELGGIEGEKVPSDGSKVGGSPAGARRQAQEHLLRPELDWLSPEIEAAIASAHSIAARTANAVQGRWLRSFPACAVIAIPLFPNPALLRLEPIYTTPKASIASATFLNPAILAPFT